jgi:hypothetical protein
MRYIFIAEIGINQIGVFAIAIQMIDETFFNEILLALQIFFFGTQ